ncbi:autotransporter outer membrane beta-barrel domain-containing protein, partial [Sutterella wadsworthensis]
AFGDKDAVATYTGGIQSVTRVVDTNPIQATLGVSAQNGAWTFGLNYGLTAGSDDRLNNSFNANARYTF